METLREIMATLTFIAGTVLIFSLIGAFHWGTLLASFACFLAAYLIWPSKRSGQRERENVFLDVLELIIEFPMEILFWLFRLIGRLFRSKEGGFDIDI
ncbi:hypothetical protein [Litorilituus sediminis]|uniref:Uncharacterized protein n=1 Tax=Litorilituus sediminis TaxID=718192 RepID=A0A4P6PBQ9_9GAMM|nr:hypothetical protein [Litorilituus sediminis]QBG37142.1 hypothetical protein EMK97_16100 [Litorilituus sediminis]